ncbi:MAG: hypothetical protein FWG66_07125 [Spirochaetes bacterium]|nr:hypothetical protein [Spirochaetota bacterium]
MKKTILGRLGFAGRSNQYSRQQGASKALPNKTIFRDSPQPQLKIGGR